MASGYCERPDCYSAAVVRCNICTTLDVPSHFGQYCSRDCQRSCYNSHNLFHKAVESNDRNRVSFTGIAETIAFALKDCSLRRILPPIRSDGVVSILLTGCRDHTEGAADYFKLYELIVQMEVYPANWISYLEVTLSGPELTSHIPYSHPSGKLKVFRLCGRLQRLFPPTTTTNPAALDATFVSPFSTTSEKVNVSHYGSFNAYNGAPALAPADALTWSYCCVIMRHPGFSHPRQKSDIDRGQPSLLEQWTPAIELLLQKEVLVITTGYSEQPPADAPASTVTVSSPGTTQSPQQSTKSTPTTSDSSPSFDRHKISNPGSPATVDSINLSAANSERAATAVNTKGKEGWTHDAVDDENALNTVFHANIVIPRTRNPFFVPRKFHTNNHSNTFPSSSGAVSYSSVAAPMPTAGIPVLTLKKSVPVYNHDVFYMAFQGRRHPAVTKQIEFYNYMTQHNSLLQEYTQSLAHDIGGGRLRLALYLTPPELELEAHGMYLQRYRLEKRLLQHEILAMQKQVSPAGDGRNNVSGNGEIAPGTPSKATEQSRTLELEYAASYMENTSPPYSESRKHVLAPSEGSSPMNMKALVPAPVHGHARVHFSDMPGGGGGGAHNANIARSVPGSGTETLKLPQLTFTRR